jgi:precorrin-6B methylase 2
MCHQFLLNFNTKVRRLGVDWSEGYVTDVGYTHGYYKELNPLLQSFSLALSGREGPSLKKPFVKVELGCGYGLSLLLEAAAFPNGKFIGVDFMPSHITWAKRIAADAQLDNITFLESSFANLLSDPIPEADFVSFHGVWSWINQDNRDAITRFLSARLKSGGVTMLSYNTLPGWSALQGLRELMMRKYHSSVGSSEVRVKEALAFARAFYKTGSSFFGLNPDLHKSLENLATKSTRYMAHEYFNKDWHLFYHHQVAEALATAKLSFATSCKPIENFERFCYPADMVELLGQVVASERETLKDIYLNRNFRYDLFGRGIDKGSLTTTIDYIRDCQFVLVNDKTDIDTNAIKPSVGHVKVKNKSLEPVLERLRRGQASGQEIAAQASGDTMQPTQLAEMLGLLIDSGFVTVAMPTEGLDVRTARTKQLNDVLMKRFLRGEDIVFLVSPVTGFGHNLTDIDKLFIMAVQSGKDAASFAWQTLRSVGRRVVQNNAIIENDHDSIKELEKRFESFAHTTLPLIKRLGFI